MKKIILTLSAIALIISMLFAFTACGASAKPELDIDKAEEAFEDEEYDTIITVGKQERAILKAHGIFGVDDGLMAKKDGDFNLLLFGGIDSLTELDYCVLTFETEDQASTYHFYLSSKYYVDIAELKSTINLLKDIIKNCDDELDSTAKDTYSDMLMDLEDRLEEIEEIKIGKGGTTVWIANEDAIEDSKK